MREVLALLLVLATSGVYGLATAAAAGANARATLDGGNVDTTGTGVLKPVSCMDPLDCCSVSKGPWQGARSSLGVVVSTGNRQTACPTFPHPSNPSNPS